MSFASIERFRHSLGWRISAWYATGFLASFVLIGLFASWVTRDVGRRADRDEIMGEMRQDAERSREVGPAQFLTEFRRKQPDIDSTLIRVSDAENRTLLLVPAFGETPREIERVGQQLPRTRRNGWQQIDGGQDFEFWQVYCEPLPDGYWLQVAKSDRRGRETRAQLHTALLPVAVLVVLLALLGAAGLTARALRPLRRLIDTTRQVILSGDMTTRVPTRGAAGHELDELSELFNRMLARGESLIGGMREALDNVAHDLRTPLTRLRSSAEASLRNPNATVLERGDALADVIEESERVLATLRTLMDISEAEHGTMHLRREPVELAEVASETVDLYEYVAESQGMRLRVDVPAGIRVDADRVRLQQVVANLLDNAIKYSDPQSEVIIAAGMLAAGTGDSVWLAVRDEGAGIPPHDLPRIWDRLYRGDRSRTERGSGLGLSLVKAVVEAHGGRAEVESEVGKGSTFRVILRASPAGRSLA